MKKVLLIAVLAIAGVANAQKGSILVAGNVSAWSQETGSAKSSVVTFSPKVGYQFNDNMTVGLETSVANYSSSDTHMFNIGAFLRYAKPLSGAFSAYADLGVGSKSSTTGSVKSSGMYIGLTPAVSIDLKKSFALNFSIGGLTYDTMKASGAADSTNSLNFNFGNAISVGVSKNF